jgi:transcriptional regulator with XRE-family HTH domain
MTMTATDKDHRRLGRQIGAKIRKRRAELDISRAELARRAELSYSAVERDERQPLVSTLLMIVLALEIMPSELLDGGITRERHGDREHGRTGRKRRCGR